MISSTQHSLTGGGCSSGGADDLCRTLTFDDGQQQGLNSMLAVKSELELLANTAVAASSGQLQHTSAFIDCHRSMGGHYFMPNICQTGQYDCSSSRSCGKGGGTPGSAGVSNNPCKPPRRYLGQPQSRPLIRPRPMENLYNPPLNTTGDLFRS